MLKTNIITKDGFVGFYSEEEKKLFFYTIVNSEKDMFGLVVETDDVEFWLTDGICYDGDVNLEMSENQDAEFDSWVVI